MMKNLSFLLLSAFFIGVNYTSDAQETTVASQSHSENFLERSPLYDYSELKLNNTDSIPDFAAKVDQLKITGVIFESDGTTPAKDVILYIEHANEHGDFDLRKHNKKRYVYHRGWIKTDVNGRYTFYTFIPGNDRRYNLLQQLFPIVKAPSNPEYPLESFLFDDDPMLTKLCRKRITKKSDPSRILKPKLDNGVFVIEKNIVMKANNEASK